MKKKMCLLLVGLMLMSGLTIFADTSSNMPVPVLISEPVPVLISEPVEESVPFEVTQKDNQFTIILDENPSTGFMWTYDIADDNHVTFVDENYVNSEVEMPGAPGKKEITFAVNKEGISTITFLYKRSWEEGSAEELKILVYKISDKLIVEEDKVVHIMDGSIEVPETIDMFYKNEMIDSELKAKRINGITMVPLSPVLKAMGYSVKWVEETRSVEIFQGAQWTSVTIDKNAYFRNRMAPWALSTAPTIIEGRSYVPVEFIAEILGKAIQVENGNLKFADSEVVIHRGYVKEIAYDEIGTKTITLTTVKDSTDVMDEIVIHTSKAYTHYNKEFKEGDSINVVSSMIMTMSIPPQTSGYIVY